MPRITSLVLLSFLLVCSAKAQEFYKAIIQSDSIRYSQSLTELSSFDVINNSSSVSSNSFYQSGLSLLRKGDFNEAIKEFKKSIKEHNQILNSLSYRTPSQRNPYPYLLIGVAKAEVGELDSAIIFTRKAIKEAPYLVDAHLELGKMFISMNMYDSAIYSFDRGLKINNESRDLHYNLGYTYFLKGSRLRSQRHLQTAISLDSLNASPYLILGQMRASQGDRIGAMMNFNKAVELGSNEAVSYYLRGSLFLESLELDSAYFDFQKVVEIDPNNVEAYFTLSAIDFSFDKPEEGFKNFNNGLNVVERDTIAYSNLDYSKLEVLSLAREYQKTNDSLVRVNLVEFFKSNVFTSSRYVTPWFIEKKARELSHSIVAMRIHLFYLVESEEWAAARRVALKINSLDPSIFTVNYILGRSYYENGEYEEAKKYFIDALALFKYHSFSLYYKAEANSDLGFFDEALRDLNTSIALNSNYAYSYNLRGNIRDRLKDFEGSLSDYNACIRIGGINHWAFNNIGSTFMGRNMLDSALFYLNKSIESNPNFSYPYFNRGRVYQKKKMFDEALESYNKSIEINDEVSLAWRYRADLYFETERLQLAIDDYTVSIKISPTAPALNMRGNIFYRLELYDSAKADFLQSIELDPDKSFGYLRAADSYYKMGLYDEAKEFYLKAIAVEPELSIAYGNLGWVCYLDGKYEDAVKYSEKAVEYDEKAVYAMYNIALAKLRLGNFKESLDLYVRYSEIDKTLNNRLQPGAIEDLKSLIKEGQYAEEAEGILKQVFKVD